MWKNNKKAQMARNKRINFYMDPELVLAFKFILAHEQIPEWYFRCFLARTFWGTGLRINELRKLKTADCNMDWFTVVEGKGGKTREVEPTPEFKPFYQQHLLKCQREGRTWFFWPDRKYGELRKYRDDPVSLRALRNWWRSLILRIGIRYLPPHEGGRKTFITWYREVMDRPDMQDQVGHEDYRTTDLYYRGSIPGRRFAKPEPEWKKWARMPEEKEKLRVIEGGKAS